MTNFSDKTAVISGGAEGIGFSVAQAVGKQGMNVVIGDIDTEQLNKAEEKLQTLGINVLAVELDVRKQEQWEKLADATLKRFGKVHMLVNNAGVSGTPGPVENTNAKDWQWVIDVNLMGVVYGTSTIVPLIKKHNEGGWLINVASMAGLGGVPYAGPYTATKVAVVGMSESWYVELKPHNIQVSVLCPAFVKTRINHGHRNKPAEYLDDSPSGVSNNPNSQRIAENMQSVINAGLAPEVVGERVIEAINNGELYIFTHPNYRKTTQVRSKAIDDAFERSAASPLLQHVLNEDIVNFDN